MTPRCACGQPAPDATICHTCETELLGALALIHGDGDYASSLACDLDLALARVARLGDRSPARGYATPLPYDERAAKAAGELRATMVGWVRDLTERAA